MVLWRVPESWCLCREFVTGEKSLTLKDRFRGHILDLLRIFLSHTEVLRLRSGSRGIEPHERGVALDPDLALGFLQLLGWFLSRGLLTLLKARDRSRVDTWQRLFRRFVNVRKLNFFLGNRHRRQLERVMAP